MSHQNKHFFFILLNEHISAKNKNVKDSNMGSQVLAKGFISLWREHWSFPQMEREFRESDKSLNLKLAVNLKILSLKCILLVLW